MEMWWLNGCTPDFWGRGSRFESSISYNDPDSLQDHCVIMWKSQGKKGEPTLEAKKDVFVYFTCKTIINDVLTKEQINND